MASKIIDPAWEVSELITRFLKPPASNDLTWAVVEKLTGVSGADLYDMLSVLAQRVGRTRQFLSTLRDDEFDENMRKRVVHALERFGGMFSTPALSQPWTTTKQAYVHSDDALQLSWVSLVAKRYKPLRMLTDEERATLIEKITEAATGIDQSSDIPTWAREPLADGLRRLHLAIAKIEFFGYEAAIDELLGVYHRAAEVEDRLAATCSTKSTRSLPILPVLNVITLAVNLFCAADMTTTAFEHYRGWQLEQIKSSPRLAKCQTRLLPAPGDQKDPHEQEPVGTLQSDEPKPSKRNSAS